jgi:hypothetical protein
MIHQFVLFFFGRVFEQNFVHILKENISVGRTNVFFSFIWTSLQESAGESARDCRQDKGD